MKKIRLCLSVCLLGGFCASVVPSWGAGSCRSGPQPGQRPGPYAAVVSVGAERGQSHCYVCEAADRPVVIVFARSLSEPLGNLVGQIDRAVERHKGAGLRAWVTFLHE